MADVKARPHAATGRSRYHGLGVFWVIVAAIVIGGGVMLQVLGPPPPSSVGKPPAPRRAVPVVSPQAQIAAPDPALQEPAPDYPGRVLPIIGKDNRMPMTVYAGHYDTADKHPRVALVIDGVGLDLEQTLHVLHDLPPGVDVAFSAYTPEDRLEKLAMIARETGHECLISVPMEPNNYPMADEGTHQLRQDHSDESNRLDLEWALSRQSGCVGVTGASDGFMGEHFANNGLEFGAVLEEVAKRGLLYLDPGTGAPALINATATAILTVNWQVDPQPDPNQPPTADLIDRRLSELEHIVAEKKQAIGVQGPPQQAILERIEVWANGLAGRGITLVPLTALLPAPVKTDDDGRTAAPAVQTLPGASQKTQPDSATAPVGPAVPGAADPDNEGPQPMTAPAPGSPGKPPAAAQP